MSLHHAFPRLTAQNHRITSPATTDYNCIAWAAGKTDRWWQPGVCWPTPASADDCGLAALVQAFRTFGYEVCIDGSLEAGFEKVALYGNATFYTHAARQLSGGNWTSKLGEAEDIEHDTPEDIAGSIYGSIVQFMKRPLATS